MEKLITPNETDDYTYDDLVQLVQDKKMTWIQFIETLPEYYPDWEEWLSENRRAKDEQAASDYIEWCEKDL